MTTIWKYIALALELGTTVEAVQALISQAETTHTPITGAQVDFAIQPAISGFESVFTKFRPSPALLTDIENAAADAINKYVLNITPAT